MKCTLIQYAHSPMLTGHTYVYTRSHIVYNLINT